MPEKIISRSSISMYEQDMVNYSIVVNRRRAIPEIRDGLKTVQRRVVYAAYKEGLTSPSKVDKSASIVGEVMKRYHPHGSTYGTFVNLGQWFKTKYPLFYIHGNYGNVSGDGAAAERYTEAALSNFGYDILIDELNQSPNIVDWNQTYKRNNDKEPEYLPTKVPLLLMNGATGIGVGMAIDIPPHNLVEVIEATRTLLRNPNAEIVLVPDLCQPCEIINTDWKEISNTGRGSFKVRGKIETIQEKNGSYTLRIVSLPEYTTTTAVYEKILKLVKEKQLPMVKDVFNSLQRDTDLPDIIIKLNQGADPNYVKQVIYAKTDVQKNMSVNFEAVSMNGIDIQRFSYKAYLQTFIDQRVNIKFRLYCNKLQQAMTKHHKIDAFVKVLESGKIDDIYFLIRKSKKDDRNKIIEYIIKNCNTTDVQANYIIDTNLIKLSAANVMQLRQDRKDLEAKINSYMPRVTDDGSLIKAEIDAELVEIEKKYGSPRLCTIIDSAKENEIPKGTFKVVITERNYIRKIPDIDKINIVRKDNPKFILRVDNAENILIFDNKGKVFNLPVSKIPITDKIGVGTDVRVLVRNLTSDIISVFYEPIIQNIAKSGAKHYMAVLSKYNTIKKLDIEDFLTVSPSGLLYSKLKDDDEIVSVALVPHNLDIVISSGHKVLRTKLKDIPLFKRNASGSKAMDTTDTLNGLSVLYPDSTDIVVLTKNGKFNRFNSALMQAHSRACKGASAIKLDASDEIFNIFGVNENDIIRVVTSEGVQDIPVASIKVKSSIAAGTKMIKGIILRADPIKA